MQFPETYLPLFTERLIIRPLEMDDCDRMVAFVSDNRDHLAPWEPARTPYYFSNEYWTQEIAGARDEMYDDRSVRMIMLLRDQPDGAVVGRINYNNIVRGVLQATHLGYAIGTAFEGKGFMTEGLTAANDFMFRRMNLHRIMANYMPNNDRSGKLLERLGFEREGLAHEYLLIANRWEDHVLTAKINPLNQNNRR